MQEMSNAIRFIFDCAEECMSLDKMYMTLISDGQVKLEDLTGCTFNSCLLNLYRNGKDSLSWHSDNEKPYGPNPTIGKQSPRRLQGSYKIILYSFCCRSNCPLPFA